MAFESMECPNCGAKIEFPAGATSTTCKFCNSVLRLKAEIVASGDAIELDPNKDPYRHLADMDQIKQLLRDGRKSEAIRLYMQQTGASLKEAQKAIEDTTGEAGLTTLPSNIGPYAVDLDRIQQLVRDGKKIDAIKLLREQTHLGLKEAKDAVEAIERGVLPTITIDQRARSVASIPFGRFGCIIGCLPILAIIAACAGLIMLTSNLAFRAWGPYDVALDMVRSSEQVQAALGTPINPGIFLMGSISSSGSDSHAHFEVPIYGSKKSGSMRVSGSWYKGVWDVSVWIGYDQDGEEQTIYLSGKKK
jgi:ribosomal protein L7/L12